MGRNSKGQFVNMREDITGQRFGRLIALNFSHKDNRRKTYWDFQCDCGNIKTLRKDSVKCGDIQSCGCLKKEQDEINLNRDGTKPTKYDSYGLSHHTLYHKWLNIKRRCYDVHSNRYDRYGGRGIRICDEWLYSFKTFYDWSIVNGWEEGLEIDRIDVDGNYEPNNCRYVTRKENCNNRSTTRKIEINGITHSITEWCEIFNMNPKPLYGKSDEKITELFLDLYANTELTD